MERDEVFLLSPPDFCFFREGARVSTNVRDLNVAELNVDRTERTQAGSGGS